MIGHHLRIPRNLPTHSPVRRIYGWSVAVRVMVGMAAYYATIQWQIPLLADALYYEQVGHSIAEGWLNGISSPWLFDAMQHGRVAWVNVMAIAGIYYLLGGLRAVPLLIVLFSLATAMVPVFIYRIALQIGAPASAAKRAAWLVALTPAFAFWSGALYKEGMVMLALSIAVHHALRLQMRWSARSLAFTLLAIVALMGLRFYLAAVMSAVLGAGLFWGKTDGYEGKKGSRRLPVVVRGLATALAFIAVLVGLGLAQRIAQPVSGGTSELLAQLNSSRQDLATSAESGYLPDRDVSTPAKAARLMPQGLLYFLTVPFPWQFGSLLQNIVIPETLLWVLLYPFALLGMRAGLRVNRPATVLILTLTASVCVLYALLAANVGVAYRMRTQVWLFLAPFAMWGWEIWRQRGAGKRAGVRGRRLHPVSPGDFARRPASPR